MLYMLIMLLIFRRRKSSTLLGQPSKYNNKRIEDTEAQQLIHQLENILKQEELYKNPDLKLPELAARLNILPHTLSQLLNDNIGIRFQSFINKYRIAEAKKRLASDHHLTLEAIGYECGFNSKSTFYTAFKKTTGTTPARFRESIK